MKIYTDGSYDKRKRDACGYGIIIVNSESTTEYDCTILYGKQTLQELIDMWNVGGEIWAVLAGLDYMINTLNLSEIDLFYDYIGIENWANRRWKTNRPATATYQRKMQKFMNAVTIRFHKVAAHTGIALNEVADQYAKAGIQLSDNAMHMIEHQIIKKG